MSWLNDILLLMAVLGHVSLTFFIINWRTVPVGSRRGSTA